MDTAIRLLNVVSLCLAAWEESKEARNVVTDWTAADFVEGMMEVFVAFNRDGVEVDRVISLVQSDVTEMAELWTTGTSHDIICVTMSGMFREAR